MLCNWKDIFLYDNLFNIFHYYSFNKNSCMFVCFFCMNYCFNNILLCFKNILYVLIIYFVLHYFSNILCWTGVTGSHFWTIVDNAPNSLYCVRFITGLHFETRESKLAKYVLAALVATSVRIIEYKIYHFPKLILTQYRITSSSHIIIIYTYDHV